MAATIASDKLRICERARVLSRHCRKCSISKRPKTISLILAGRLNSNTTFGMEPHCISPGPSRISVMTVTHLFKTSVIAIKSSYYSDRTFLLFSIMGLEHYLLAFVLLGLPWLAWYTNPNSCFFWRGGPNSWFLFPPSDKNVWQKMLWFIVFLSLKDFLFAEPLAHCC